MTGVSAFWLYPIIIVAGLLQAMGPPRNGALRTSLTNPWVATLISFGLVFALFVIVAAIFPRPLPTAEGIARMPWWAPLGEIIGAIAVIAGLLFVERVGAGPLAALPVSANLLMSIAIDHWVAQRPRSRADPNARNWRFGDDNSCRADYAVLTGFEPHRDIRCADTEGSL